MKNEIGATLRDVRKELKLTRERLETLSKTSIKAIYNLELGKGRAKGETLIKIRNTLKNDFGLDLFERSGVKFVWELKDLDQKTLNIIEGSLLGDGCIGERGVYTQAAKDKKYLEWLAKLLGRHGIECKVIHIHRKSSDSYWLYTYYCPAFLELRRKWYHNYNGKVIKKLPNEIELTPTTLLHWYLGDGNFKRDRRYKLGRPYVRLCTNDFVIEDIKLLIKKLKELGLDFYPSPKLDVMKEKGYVLCLYVKDTFRFFKLIGFSPIKEIKNCVTKILKNGKVCRFKGRWPTKDDWVRILAKTKGIGKVLREKRKEAGMTQKEFGEKIGTRQSHITDIEAGRKYTNLKRFEKVIEVLELDVYDVLRTLVGKISNKNNRCD